METRELGINAGLQDRVIQAYGGLVFMDFSKEHMIRGYGEYEPLSMDNVRARLWAVAHARARSKEEKERSPSACAPLLGSFPTFGWGTWQTPATLARFTATCASATTTASPRSLRKCGKVAPAPACSMTRQRALC